MDWLLILGIGLLIYGTWIWIQRNRPSSPLLRDDALVELYSTLRTIKIEMNTDGKTSIVQQTPSNRMMISYLFQGQAIGEQQIFVHNLSLTIPEKAIKTLHWNKETQLSVTHFILNSLRAPSNVTVHSTNNGILSINFIFSNNESHEQFMQYELPDVEAPQSLRKVYQNVTIQKLQIDPDADKLHTSDESNQSPDQSEEPA